MKNISVILLHTILTLLPPFLFFIYSSDFSNFLPVFCSMLHFFAGCSTPLHKDFT
jgi:hypothetical protein